jgi:sugar phosphate isomerase/epimerase
MTSRRATRDLADCCFWAASALPLTMKERIEAAGAGGFGSVSLFPSDCPTPRRAREARREIEACGLHVGPLDPCVGWQAGEPARSRADDGLGAMLDFGEEEFFAIAAALEVTSVTAIQGSRRRYAPDESIGAFRRLCARAADHGIRVHLEFMPFSGIPDLATAWRIVAGADCANGGLVFDTWHYMRGAQDEQLLQQIPGERIFELQISDAAEERGRPSIAETMTARRLPSEHSGALRDIVRALLAKQGMGRVGIEVVSSEMWSRFSAEELGRQCGASLMRLLAEV